MDYESAEAKKTCPAGQAVGGSNGRLKTARGRGGLGTGGNGENGRNGDARQN